MKRRRTIIFGLCLLLAAGVIIVRSFFSEPRADGHALSYWLKLGAGPNTEDLFSLPKPKADADAAVRKIGERAVPDLLMKLRFRDPKWREPTVDWVRQHLGLAFRQSKAEVEWNQAQYGFRVLGTQAVVAIPALGQMLLNTNTAFNAAYALASIGRDATPAIRIALTNADPEICQVGILATGWSKDIGRELVPELTALVSSSNSDQLTANYAAMQLRALLPVEEYVRLMTRASGPNQPMLHRIMLRTLAETNVNASFAVPLVVSLLANPDERTRKLATNALRKMDRPTAAAHGIDTNAPTQIPGFTGRRRASGVPVK